MSDPFVGEIKMFAGNFAPRGWAFCNGQLLAITSNETLYSLIGTIYGGDGHTTFALPDMRGRIPIQPGTGPGLLPRQIGERGGSETETLTAAHLPAHNHTLRSNNATGSQSSPAEAIWADSSQPHYTTNHSLAQTMNPQMLESTGGSAPHDNMMPFATLSFIIALTGIFPPRQ